MPSIDENGPPYVIRTQRVVLRCMGPEDVARRQDAVDSSTDHLAATVLRGGPLTLEGHVRQIRKLRAGFDQGGDRGYGAFDPADGRMLGETGLMKRVGVDALEVSYWLRKDATGRGLATHMAGAMVKVAFEIDRVKRVDLYCAADNARSAKVAERLGFTLEGRLRERQLVAHHPRGDLLCFSLLDREYPGSLACGMELEAVDFLGRRMG